jgi:hypothetical protein
MPIRVNLKELFPADSQEITIDKVNFNFNKLLELGIGEPGIQGLSGIQGPAGPLGLVGPAGLRGSTWFVDSGDPNTLTGFVDLLDNDLYLDTALFNVWQYDLATDTWTLVASISTIVNNYLSSTPSPFRRGLGLSSPEDDRFITFNRRGETYLDSQLDVNLGTLNPANSDTLFLNNFNEDVLNSALANFSFTANPGELFNSLLSIYSNHNEGASISQGRYHLEMGSLYENTQVGPSQVEMSELKHNLKAKFLKEDVSLTTPLTSTNYWLNIARFSLGKLENSSVATIDQNGRFEFVVPKYNDEGLSTIQGEVTISLGAAEALIEQSAVPPVVPDGISISSASNGLILGLKEGLENDLTLPYSPGNADFALFDVSSGLNGFFFNDNLFQSSGNIVQLITNELEILEDESFYSGSVVGHYMHQGIFIGSNTLWLASGSNSLLASSVGVLARYDITNPVNPVQIFSETGTRNFGTAGIADAEDQHGHLYRDDINQQYPKFLGLIRDVAEYGKYLVTVSNRSSTGADNDFAIYETDSQFNRLLERSRIEEPELEAAYRVHVNGRYAWVITNSTTATGPRFNTTVPPPPLRARLTAVDLIDPENPVVVDSYEDTQPGSKYLDFKIFDNKAIVLKYTNYQDLATPANSTHKLELLTFDIFDPTGFGSLTIETTGGMGVGVLPFAPMDTQLLETLTIGTTRTEYGTISVQGRDVFIAWEGKLYVVQLNSAIGAVVAGASNFLGSTSLSGETVYANDIVVRGRYAYVLVNYADSTGALQVYDISDTSSPLLVSETREAALRNSSRFVVQGKYAYVVSSQAGTDAKILTIDLNGIESPGANIGSIRTTDLQVIGNAHVKNNLQVKNSLNVGPGGIFVDNGVGIITDSPIVTSSISGFSTDFKELDTTDAVSGFEIEVPEGSNTGDFNGVQVNAHANVDSAEIDINGDFTGVQVTAISNSNSDINITGDFTGIKVTSDIIGINASNVNISGDFIGSDVFMGGGIAGAGTIVSGDIIGSNLFIGRYTEATGSVYGSKISTGSIPASSIGGDVFGYEITANLDIDGARNFYGFRVDAAGVDKTGTGEKYGIFAKDTSFNRLDGELRVNDHPALILTGNAPGQTAGTNQFVSGHYSSGDTTMFFMRVGDIVHCTGRAINGSGLSTTRINVPLGLINLTYGAFGLANTNDDNPAVADRVPSRITAFNSSQVLVEAVSGSFINPITDIYFTFSYYLAV